MLPRHPEMAAAGLTSAPLQGETTGFPLFLRFTWGESPEVATIALRGGAGLLPDPQDPLRLEGNTARATVQHNDVHLAVLFVGLMGGIVAEGTDLAPDLREAIALPATDPGVPDPEAALRAEVVMPWGWLPLEPPSVLPPGSAPQPVWPPADIWSWH